MNAEPSRSDAIKTSFYNGALAGFISLGFAFLIRLGGYSPFPPEAALQYFLRFVPASIEEPAVQSLGDLAGELGLAIATTITIIVYGLFAVLFQNTFSSRLAKFNSLKSTERFLLYSLIPWAFFGLIVLPLAGVSTFGINSPFAVGSSTWIVFPITLLLSQMVYALVLQWEFKSSLNPAVREMVAEKREGEESVPTITSRRAFIERGVITFGAVIFLALSLNRILPSALSQGQSGSTLGGGTPINLALAPEIFSDPRLALLVDSEVTKNDSFYRVAIDLFDPSVDGGTWQLQLNGLVANQKNYSLDQLMKLPLTEQYNTFECVSNLVNGNLIGNAQWSGFKISDLLSDAGGASPNAKYIVFYSVDGYSVDLPLSKALMSDSMLAYGMNGVTLPQKHGYPLRAVIPGLYGMMSAKWINRIELVDSPYSGYWQTRDWSPIGVVQTLAFIMVPQDGGSASLKQYNGSVLLGGVAYAGDRGISKVEVSTDQGKTWQEAQLKPAISNITWRLWAFDWHPTSTGTYSIYARATDGTGALQTSQEQGNFPNGATGYAITTVYVES